MVRSQNPADRPDTKDTTVIINERDHLQEMGGRAPPRRNMRWPSSRDLVRLTQFTDLALQFLDPILLGACQPTASPSVTFGLLTPDTQTVG